MIGFYKILKKKQNEVKVNNKAILEFQINSNTFLIQGHGAFGKVYQATFMKNGKDFALKKISKK